MAADKKYWKVGELAKRTGITVRTLHHYDQLGLLSPSKDSDAGHRLYTASDISKLQQILSLKQWGFSLQEIKDLMEHPHYRPREAIRLQLERVTEQIRMQEDLRDRLQELYQVLGTRQDVTVEQLLKIIEVMKMTQNYFTPEQMEKVKKQGELLGSEKIQEVEKEWSVLIARVRKELEKGTPPEDPEVAQLAKRWQELVNLFTGGDAEIRKAAERYYAENPDMAAQMGIDKKLFQYITKAMSKS